MKQEGYDSVYESWELLYRVGCTENAASSINGIITKLGNTPYHICYSVDNIDEAVERRKMKAMF